MSCLILIGMMGAGKTTVGKELARRRKLRFADCDQAIAARTGRNESEVLRVLVEAQTARESSGPPSSFGTNLRPDLKASSRGSAEDRDLQMIRTLLDFLHVNNDRTTAPRAKKTS